MNQTQWREFLNKSSITNKEWNNAHNHSNWWCSCAVGSLTLNDESFIPISPLNTAEFLKAHKENSPDYHTEVYSLGHEFNEAIEKHDQTTALEIYNKIAIIV